jgi:hypothetical protein
MSGEKDDATADGDDSAGTVTGGGSVVDVMKEKKGFDKKNLSTVSFRDRLCELLHPKGRSISTS